MCEREHEQQRKKEAQDLIEIEPVSIKVEVKGRGIEILIHTADGCDALEISGACIRHLRIMDLEPKGVILP